MKMVKSLLLGAAAGFVAFGAQAADLPGKAAPATYVKICDTYGAGYYYIPGTQTCLSVSGYAMALFAVDGAGAASNASTGYLSSYAAAEVSFDARTQTEYGLLRSLVSFYARRGANPEVAAAFGSTASDRNSWFALSNAFVQFGGLTAGYAPSFFNPISSLGTIDLGTLTTGIKKTNMLAYTASFGGGFLATVAIEDPAYFRSGFTTANATAFAPGAGTFLLNQTYAGVVLPDFVAALRVQQGWGAVQIAGALHELRGYGATLTGNDVISQLGYAVSAGAEINLDMLAKGDVLKLAAIYAYGSNVRLFNRNSIDGVTFANTWALGASGAVNFSDFDTTGGTLNVSSGYSLWASLKHFWTPAVSTTLFGGYISVDANSASALNDFQYGLVGGNAVYEITKGLFLGGELYWRTLNRQNSVGAQLGNDSAIGGTIQVKRTF